MISIAIRTIFSITFRFSLLSKVEHCSHGVDLAEIRERGDRQDRVRIVLQGGQLHRVE